MLCPAARRSEKFPPPPARRTALARALRWFDVVTRLPLGYTPNPEITMCFDVARNKPGQIALCYQHLVFRAIRQPKTLASLYNLT